MARGFLNARHKTGGAAAVNEYTLASGQDISAGDAVSLAAGVISRVTSAAAIHGICAGYKATATTDFPTSLTTGDTNSNVLVYDDLRNTVFEAVVTGTNATTNGVGKAVAYTAGTQVTQGSIKRSAAVGAVGSPSAGQGFRILGAVKRPGNALGDTNCDCYVEVNLA